MPHIVFTITEVLDALIAKSRALSEAIRELSDLAKKPLDPGEGVAARHHKLAKLGKQLAETFEQFDTIMRDVTVGGEHAATPDAPSTPDNSQAN
jgi:hypothetical protein